MSRLAQVNVLTAAVVIAMAILVTILMWDVTVAACQEPRWFDWLFSTPRCESRIIGG